MTCPACGSEVTGHFCSNCGQRAGSRVLSLRVLVRDVLDDQFSLNATLPRTLWALFFKPGLLTSEYLRHRVSPYVPPFRLYLVTSVLFFLAVAVQPPPLELTAEDRAAIDSVRAALRDTVAARAARGEPPPRSRFGVSIDPGREDWAASAEVRLGSERLNRAVKARLLMLGELPPEEAFRRLIRGTIENTPKVMFLLLPFYALLLKLLYIRSRRYYVEHFIFALHGHAFAFSLFLVMLLLDRFPVVAGILAYWVMVYFWVAMKRVYQQGWLRTTSKWLALGQTYLLAVAFGLVLAFIAAIFTV